MQWAGGPRRTSITSQWPYQEVQAVMVGGLRASPYCLVIDTQPSRGFGEDLLCEARLEGVQLSRVEILTDWSCHNCYTGK